MDITLKGETLAKDLFAMELKYPRLELLVHKEQCSLWFINAR